MYKLFLIATALTLSAMAKAETFKLSSVDIVDGKTITNQQVYNGFGCDGKNISPQLVWSGTPAGTKSFAVTVYDPDAPTGSGWWHWTVVNIPPSTVLLPAGAGNNADLLPSGAVQGRTDFGTSGFGGACPPVGEKPHRYQFTVWALKIDKLPVDESASGALVGYMLNVNLIAKAQITAMYGR